MHRKKIIIFAPVLITLIYMGVALSVFSRCYATNDNLGILWDIKSDCMVYFMSVSLGKMLSFCYLSISDVIPWYGLTLYVFLGISIYLVLFSLLKFEHLGRLLISFLAVFLVFFLRHIVCIDYSAVSILLGSASLLGLVIYLEKTDKKHFLPVLIMGICFSFSYHIRMSGINAVLCFVAPAALFGIFRIRKDYKYLLVFMIPLIIAIPADHCYRRSLETDADIHFREWNTLRGQFHQFPVQYINNDNEKIREVNRWSENDYYMLSNWIFLDENKFNMHTLKNVFDYSPPHPTVTLPLIKRNLVRFVKMYPVHLCFLTLIALLGFVTGGKNGGIIAIIYLGYIFAGAMWMQLFLRFPARIGLPILLGCIAWMTYIVFNMKMRPAYNNCGKKLIISACLLLLLFACAGVLEFWKIDSVNNVSQKKHFKSIKELEEMGAEFFLIKTAHGLTYKLSDPLKSDNYNFKSVYDVGWTPFSPRFYKTLRANGMEHAYEIFPRLVNDENCFVVGDEKFITAISIYLSETYGLQTTFTIVKELSNHRTVYKIEVL